MKNEIITREAQEAAGLIRRAQGNFVSPVPEQRQPLLPPATSAHSTIVDVPINALQVVSVQTTERDRSMGYLLRTVPLSIAFAIVVVAMAITLFEEPLFSWTAFIVFWLSMVGAWMFGEYRLGKSSPYAANIMEIQRKWDNIDANDQRRWDAWEKVTGIVTPADSGASWVDRHKTAIITWVVVSVLWMIVASIVLIAEVSK